jgi:hypothetical protein
LIDWRESFNGKTNGGDLYYDLAKLYTGCIFPFILFNHQQEIKFIEEGSDVKFEYPISNPLKEFTKKYETWILENGYDIKKVKSIAGLIFFQISCLHEDLFNKIFFYKSIEILNEVYG